MKLNSGALAIAAAGAFAIIWTLCSLFVLILPSMMSVMTGHMIHAHLDAFEWMLTLTGYLIGLIAWSAWAAGTAWLIAIVYNRVASD